MNMCNSDSVQLRVVKTRYDISHPYQEYTVDEHEQLHGTYIEWNHLGQLYIQSEYSHGKLHGKRQRWHNKGYVWEQTEYLNGKLHGIRSLHNQDGSIYKIEQYENNTQLVCVNFDFTPILIKIYTGADVESTKFITDIITQLTSEGKNYEIEHC